MPAQISRDEKIEALTELAQELGERPRQKDMNELGRYSASAYYSEFGCWNDALEAAGLMELDREECLISTDELIQELIDIGDKIGKPPTVDDVQENGSHHPSTYRERFGSWSDALSEAGFEINKHHDVSDESLLKELHRVAVELGRPPKKHELTKYSEYSSHTYIRRFGGLTDARELAGLERTELLDENRISESKLIENLKSFAEKVDGSPTSNEMRDFGPHTDGVYEDRFGSWNQALKAAGLEVNVRNDMSKIVSCAWCSETIERKPVHIERSKRHFCSPSCQGKWKSENHVGEAHPNWEGGKEKYQCDWCGDSFKICECNIPKAENHFCSKDCQSSWKSEEYRGEGSPVWKGGKSSYYGGNWSQKREEALSRDDFKCRVCSLTQDQHQEQYGEDLHVHHIQPLRTFEEPEDANFMDNLVSLCRKCHSNWEGIPVFPN